MVFDGYLLIESSCPVQSQASGAISCGGAGFPLLVSSKFKEIYEREGLSGIEEFSSPVNVVRMGTLKSGQFPVSPPTYHLIHVPWGGANQDDVASGLTYEHPEMIKCAFCRVGVTWKKQERVVLEEGSWNGSDIFKPRNAPVPFMVSERFKRWSRHMASRICGSYPRKNMVMMSDDQDYGT